MLGCASATPNMPTYQTDPKILHRQMLYSATTNECLAVTSMACCAHFDSSLPHARLRVCTHRSTLKHLASDHKYNLQACQTQSAGATRAAVGHLSPKVCSPGHHSRHCKANARAFLHDGLLTWTSLTTLQSQCTKHSVKNVVVRAMVSPETYHRQCSERLWRKPGRSSDRLGISDRPSAASTHCGIGDCRPARNTVHGVECQSAASSTRQAGHTGKAIRADLQRLDLVFCQCKEQGARGMIG